MRAKKLIGDELQFLQFGGMPKDAKPFKGVGSGVIEIAVKFNKDAFRCVQAVQLGDTIYVLHAFQKKSSTGNRASRFRKWLSRELVPNRRVVVFGTIDHHERVVVYILETEQLVFQLSGFPVLNLQFDHAER